MRISRLFEIVYLLLDKEKMTAQELAEHFEVSRRTIHRDIDSLLQAGIPLYTQRGTDGGISIMKGFVLDKALLTEEEQSHILIGLSSSPAPSSVQENKALEKLSLLFNKPQVDWIEVDFSRWGYAHSDEKRFDTLKQAILSGRSLRITYVNAQAQESEREVFPLKLVFKSKAWYLQAYCQDKKDYRTFKINRINHITPGEAFFDRNQFDPPPLEDPRNRPHAFVRLELIFSADAASQVYDEFDIQAIEASEDGELHVYTEYPKGDYLNTLLASFGDSVTIVSITDLEQPSPPNAL